MIENENKGDGARKLAKWGGVRAVANGPLEIFVISPSNFWFRVLGECMLFCILLP